MGQLIRTTVREEVRRRQLSHREMQRRLRMAQEQVRLLELEANPKRKRTRQPWVGSEFAPDRLVRRLERSYTHDLENAVSTMTDLLKRLGGYVTLHVRPGGTGRKGMLHVRCIDLGRSFGSRLIPITGYGPTADEAMADALARCHDCHVVHTITMQSVLVRAPGMDDPEVSPPDADAS